MKNVFTFSLCVFALAIVSFTNPPDILVGRWQKKFKGINAVFVFRNDNTFDLFVNGKVFTNGKYSIRQDTFMLADPKCNSAYYGTYKLDFFAGDSVRFIALADTCKPRKHDLHNATVGRIRPGQTK